VDPGIDTGPVLERRLVRVEGGEPVAALRGKLRALWAEMTAGLVAAAAAGPLPPGLPQTAKSPLCRTVRDPAARARVAAALAAGAALTLFERWAPLLDPQDLSLPAGAAEPRPTPPAEAGAPVTP
ncbi:MAG TPA: hypothetical protein VM890_02525, partial [Longimicrobium sp.]|nr:hypothetical protein [Longimicrobium sp.]